MIGVKLKADTEEEIKEKSKRYLDHYPTQGYSTHLRTPEVQDDGTWICTGYRWASCD